MVQLQPILSDSEHGMIDFVHYQRKPRICKEDTDDSTR